MQIVVFSDSHGYLDYMKQVIEDMKPELVVHLGDCVKDVYEIKRLYPQLKVEYVKGNCDIAQEPEEKVLMIEDKKILICHGHTYHVKSGYLSLEYGAREKQVDPVLFGHTHQAYYNNHNGLAWLNPGSIGMSILNGSSYGVLTVEGDKIKPEVRFVTKGIL